MGQRSMTPSSFASMPPGSTSTTPVISPLSWMPDLSLRELQETLAEKGQMFALDPPLGEDARATIGGIVATSDSGPLRHRYGSARDLVVGMTVALSDGTVAQSGGKVIKNVAGYDLSKLFTGSYGTLGAILKLSLRLHPLSPENATAVGRSSDPAALAAAALAAEPRPDRVAEPRRALGGRLRLGAGALRRRGRRRTADDAAESMKAHGLDTEVSDDDAELAGPPARGAALGVRRGGAGVGRAGAAAPPC